MAKLIPLEHPGIILKEEFIEPLGLSAYKVSKEAKIDQTALGQILRGKRKITPVNALKLSKFFGMSEEFFLNLQTRYDLDLAKESGKKAICQIIPFRPKNTKNIDLLEA